MRTNLWVAALVYPMIQAVLFGVCMVGLLVSGAPSSLYPILIGASFLASLPISLWIAPRLRSRAWRREHGVSLTPS